jgi:FlaG/FlaF family flagellin (archaellin)
MPANTSPIFTLTPNIGVATPSAANTKSDGTGTIGTDIFKALVAGANGSFVNKVRFSPIATAASTGTTATVGRVFLCSKSSGATTGGTDTWLWGEVTLPALTADQPTVPLNPIELILNIALPSGWAVLITNHAAPAASTGWQALVSGGDY